MSEAVDRIFKAIAYVEANIGEDISLMAVSNAACFSHYHFLRLFLALTGMTIGAYIRRRRLSIAAGALLSSETRIIEIAQAAGFDSQAAFSRAFKDMFECAPASFRRNGMGVPHLLQKPLTRACFKTSQTGVVVMEPRFTHVSSFVVAGIGEDYSLALSHQIPALWDRFCGLVKGGIAGREGDSCYGVCHGDVNSFHYVAAVRVDPSVAVPVGLERVEISAGDYAVFTHRGPTTKLNETMDYIWKVWVLKSGYEIMGAPDFELYDHRWTGEALDSEIDVYVPVRRVG